MSYYFIVGRGAGELEPDVMSMDADDGYGALHKMHASTVYATRNLTFDWLLRVDDDTFVVPSRVLSLLQDFEQDSLKSTLPKAEMIGSYWTPELNWGTGGAGLLFSRRVVEYQAARGIWPDCTDGDDGWACACAREAGAAYHWSARLKHHRHLDMWPAPTNDMITSHYATPDDMEVMQAAFDQWGK